MTKIVDFWFRPSKSINRSKTVTICDDFTIKLQPELTSPQVVRFGCKDHQWTRLDETKTLVTETFGSPEVDRKWTGSRPEMLQLGCKGHQWIRLDEICRSITITFRVYKKSERKLNGDRCWKYEKVQMGLTSAQMVRLGCKDRQSTCLGEICRLVSISLGFDRYCAMFYI
jgi:hypothetical protein